MTLAELKNLTRVYARDTNSYMFSDANIRIFLNECISRLKQYKTFNNMPSLEYDSDEVQYIPEQYQYILAIYASSRCFEFDERFYEAIEKRNEFEALLSEFINELESGNITIYDEEGEIVDDVPNYVEYIKEDYFKPKRNKNIQ